MSKALHIKSKLKANTLISVERFRSHVTTTQPHAHNKYLELVFLTQGSGHHTIDYTRYPVTNGSLFIIKQGQVHFWEMDAAPKGYVILMTHAFMANCLDPQIPSLISQLHQLDMGQVAHPEELTPYLELLLQEIDNRMWQPEIVDGLLKALLGKMLSVKPHKKVVRTDQQSAQFIQLIETHLHMAHAVKFYAEKMHMSPQNLNSICQKEVGQNASALIANLTINRAKRLLMYTSKTVAEIAHEIGFKDASHFTKFYKRHQHQTPKQFKELLSSKEPS
jgi:AraC-like DNA-binding protein